MLSDDNRARLGSRIDSAMTGLAGADSYNRGTKEERGAYLEIIAVSLALIAGEVTGMIDGEFPSRTPLAAEKPHPGVETPATPNVLLHTFPDGVDLVHHGDTTSIVMTHDRHYVTLMSGRKHRVLGYVVESEPG